MAFSVVLMNGIFQTLLEVLLNNSTDYDIVCIDQ